jgi:nucleoside-diphosphate-sugar epimerase
VRVVVTGATGNVGTSLLDALGDDGAIDSLVGIARRVPSIELPKTTWARADVSEDDLGPHFRGADVVVHLAWLIQPSRDPVVLRATNVDGTRRVLDAVDEAGVPSLVYASSVGAYSPGPKDRGVDESWPTNGVPSSFYSRHKAETEHILDAFERDHSNVRVARLRPGLIFKRGAASGVRRLFAGPFVPTSMLRRYLIPVVPNVPRLVFQAVHTDDVAEAYRGRSLRRSPALGIAARSARRRVGDVEAPSATDASGLARPRSRVASSRHHPRAGGARLGPPLHVTRGARRARCGHARGGRDRHTASVAEHVGAAADT